MADLFRVLGRGMLGSRLLRGSERKGCTRAAAEGLGFRVGIRWCNTDCTKYA